MIHHFLILLSLVVGSADYPGVVKSVPYVGTTEACFQYAVNLPLTYADKSYKLAAVCTPDPNDPGSVDALRDYRFHGIPVMPPDMKDAPTGPDPHNAP